jgi:uncharacterized coiled-coil protein SlyX
MSMLDMHMSDSQYVSELEARYESQKGEIDLLQSDLTETRKMVKTARDTNANLTVTLEELRLRNACFAEFYKNKYVMDEVDDSKLTDKEKDLNAHIEREAGYKDSLFQLIYLQRAMLDILCDVEPQLDPKEMVHSIVKRWEIDRLEG